MNELKTHFITREKLPLVIEPEGKGLSLSELATLLKTKNGWFKDQMLKYGGLLFRNFPVNTPDDFSTVIQALDTGKSLNYIGGDSPRTHIKDGIYTSTEAPPSIKIPLHNELSFVNKFPTHIYFCCMIAPEKDGETILGDSRQMLRSLDPAVKKRFIDNRLKYTSAYYYKSKVMEWLNKLQPSHKSWIQVFETEDKKMVERLCKENQFALKWNGNDWLQISQERPAAIQHPITKEDVWFNQAHLFDFNPRLLGMWRYVAAQGFYYRPHTKLHTVSYADGSPIRREDFYHIMDTLDENTIAFPWQKGDLMVLDNVLSMHGRATFTGKRRVLAAMTG